MLMTFLYQKILTFLSLNFIIGMYGESKGIEEL
jgi:hypothetical protein